jgi:hypothetical protein
MPTIKHSIFAFGSLMPSGEDMEKTKGKNVAQRNINILSWFNFKKEGHSRKTMAFVLDCE